MAWAPAPASRGVLSGLHSLQSFHPEAGWKNRFPPLGQGWGRKLRASSQPPSLHSNYCQSFLPTEIKPLASLLINSEPHHSHHSQCHQIPGIGAIFFFSSKLKRGPSHPPYNSLWRVFSRRGATERATHPKRKQAFECPTLVAHFSLPRTCGRGTVDVHPLLCSCAEFRCQGE